ncbi:MAG: sigma-70 family RNA polymerase sigma factor [Cyanobacteria bacterium J06638_22]
MHVSPVTAANHSLIRSLAHYSDQELLTLFQRHPDSGQYFTTLFCRYHPLVQTLIRHSARSPVQADYLFAQVWRYVFYELGDLDLSTLPPEHQTLQAWLINVTALCINKAELPPVESIHYSLKAAPPPLWCYVERAMEQLDPAQRLMVLMAQTFHWSETRIAAYLQAEGEYVSPAEVRLQLRTAYHQLEDLIPEDIQEIFMDGQTWGEEMPPVPDGGSR